jgi:ParB/RepB/Spo0J family partition protein
MTTVIDVAPSQVRPSPFNHRKNFTGIDELGASLLEKGMINPITARPTPEAKKNDEPYELVAGERRWRAAVKVNLESIPIIVRELSDKEVIEIQLVENVQRADVHPLEEADGYRELIDKHGYDVDGIAAKTGKSRSSVFARLKLCDIVGKYAREAFLEDKINASIALIAARIPVPKLQDAFVKKVLDGEAEREAIDGEYVHIKRTLSFREAQLLAQREFMLRLENAPFAIVDDKLVKGVGACVGCLFRTGNQRELFDDVKSADVCTNPPCFEKKKNAQAEREVAAWKAEGGKVVAKGEADKLFQKRYDGETALQWGAPYANAEEKAPYDVDRKQRTWKELFGGESVPVVLAVDENGKKWQLVHKTNAVKALQKSGALKKKEAAKSPKSTGPRSNVPTEAELIEARVWKKLIDAIADKAEPKLVKGDAGAWRWLAEFVVWSSCIGEGYAPMKAFTGLSTAHSGDIEKKALASAKTGEDVRRLAIAAVLSDRLGASGGATKEVEKICKPWAVDWKKLSLLAADEVRAELAKKKADKATKKTPAKKKAA